MSYCKDFGKDKVIFLDEEDAKKTSELQLEDNADESPGLILESGEINWSCPCLGGMATGPCGVEFREAFSCFHFSKEDPKGSDCYEPFSKMQDCMSKYPSLYARDSEEKDTVSDEKQEAVSASTSSSSSSNSNTEHSITSEVSSIKS